MAQAAADAFQERLVPFAVRITDMVTCLPKTTAGRHIAGQVLRSGASPAPNHAEARGAASRARLRFASADKPSLKLRLAGRSLAKTGIRLLIILEARMAREALVTGLAKENRELARERLTTGR